METVRSDNPSKEASKKLRDILEIKKSQPVLLMLSGGSAFAILEKIESASLGPNITLTVLDERFSNDRQVNNFMQLEKTDFYTKCLERSVNVISTEVKLDESREEVASKWNSALRAWRENNPDGIIIATIGIGNDGHTAGIFAGDFEVDFNSDEWLVAYAVPKTVNEYNERITITNTFLKTQVDEAIVYAVGDNKKEIIDKLSKSECDSSKIPACIIRDLKKVSIYTDL